ncbi:MAG: phenylalanine--tRNA ligase subunit beta [Candidatus Micrarchaeota archaeon]|nr:phenylalanine--tRNA ligase subunit beta [Candidatus Micrarchaeota archaeon]
MVNSTFNKSYLFKLLGTKLLDKKLEELIMKMGFDVEGHTKEEVQIDFPANRPDLIDIVGFARAARNFMHKGREIRYETQSTTPEFEIEVGTAVKDIRPFISGMVVKGIKFDEESLRHLLNFTEKFTSNFGRGRRKLAIGLHDLSSVEPPLVYDAIPDETFLALNMPKSMKFSQILSSSDKGKAYASTLQGSKLYPAVKDAKGAISLVPILNSERTKVTASTNSMFIEITGTNRYAVEKSADLFASIFIDMGAKVLPIKVRYGNSSTILPKMEETQIKIPLIKIESQIGVIIGFNNVISLANKMGYKAGLLGRDIKFWVPTYRLDVINDQDVVEDIAIGYGYDYIQPVPVFAEQVGELEESSKRNARLSETMLGLGFSEALNSFMSNEETNFAKMRLAKPASSYVKVRDAKMQQITMLRTWVIPSLLSNIGMSLHEKMPQRLFETDYAFTIDKKINEVQNLAGVITDPKANFNQIKSVVESVMRSIGAQYQIRESLHRSFIEGRSASIILNGNEIGVFGELHPEVLVNFGIEEPSVAFEISL